MLFYLQSYLSEMDSSEPIYSVDTGIKWLKLGLVTLTD